MCVEVGLTKVDASSSRGRPGMVSVRLVVFLFTRPHLHIASHLTANSNSDDTHKHTHLQREMDRNFIQSPRDCCCSNHVGNVASMFVIESHLNIRASSTRAVSQKRGDKHITIGQKKLLLTKVLDGWLAD